MECIGHVAAEIRANLINTVLLPISLGGLPSLPGMQQCDANGAVKITKAISSFRNNHIAEAYRFVADAFDEA